MAEKLYEFTVEGQGEFPVDMLRYDACWPKRESQDVGTIMDTFRALRRGRDLHRVTLQSAFKQPTVGRWESFGWRVIESRRVR